MRTNVTYVWTHDSIGLGEDGPTHQPVEHVASLRLIPNFSMVRPADGNETVAAWKTLMERHTRQGERGPVGLALTRQNVPVFDLEALGAAVDVAEGVARGGYVLAEATGGTPKVILIGTGSEVQLARRRRARRWRPTASRPAWCRCRAVDWFEEQDRAYRDSVLPESVKARVSVEAGVGAGWAKYVGDHGRSVSLEHFGASADYQTLYREFGITAEAVEAAARESADASVQD